MAENTEIVLFAILRFLIGVFVQVYGIGIVLAIELVGPKWRVTVNNAFYYAYILGEIIILILYLIFRDLVAFNIAISVLFCLFIAYFWLVPESPRYLIIKGRKDEAVCIFTKIAKSNKRTFDPDILLKKDNQTNRDSQKTKVYNILYRILVS